jgi:ABC-type transport system substrate-binding protein
MLMALALLAAVGGGCGGGSSSSSGTSASGKNTILRIGTTYYIDSLNPLLAYEPQASNAFTMIYPQLVQYGPGLKIAPDWATSWEESKDGLTWTFHLKPGGKWSDGVPLTAEDAVWWVNTIFKYQNGATSYLAGELAGLEKIAAPDPNTLVLTYKKPVPSALANLEQFYFMPKHVWSKYTGNDGKDMKSFDPEQHLPVVSGGPYTITQFQEKGTTVFKPNPHVKEALEYAIPRHELVDVVYGGHAQPWANIMSAWSGPSGWLNPDVKPLPYDVSKANQILDQLGYARGSNGIRVAPATTGQYAQPAHPMSYNVIVPNDLDFNGDRQFSVLAAALAKVGVQLHEISGGDVSQAYDLITAPNYTYKNADMFTWYWHPYIDPNYNLSVVTRAQWGNSSDTGFDDPTYDAMWRKQAGLVSFKQRQQLVWQMEAYLAQKRPYIQLVDTDVITAHSNSWTGFDPQLWGYCKCFYTSPHPTG